MRLRFLLLIQFFVLTLSAQNRVVTGVVTDADATDEPLMAATVAVLDGNGNTERPRISTDNSR